MAGNGNMKMVYVITKRDEKSFWNRIGVAFTNKDGSINVRLDALPVSGEMQIRDYEPKEDGEREPRETKSESVAERRGYARR